MVFNLAVLSWFASISIAYAGADRIDPVKPVVKLDLKASHAVWTAKTDGGQHSAKVRFKSGKFIFSKNVLSGGEWIADLKGVNFLEVGKVHEAIFTLKGAREIHNLVPGHPNVELDMVLTLKRVTQPFTARVMMDPIEGGFTVEGTLEIDRSRIDLHLVARK
jgi:hypothetical protein